jgi:hypothetical protein
VKCNFEGSTHSKLFYKESLSILISFTLIPKSQHILESFPLTGKTCESTLCTQGFQTHVVVGDETAEFGCLCSKVVPKQEDEN